MFNFLTKIKALLGLGKYFPNFYKDDPNIVEIRYSDGKAITGGVVKYYIKINKLFKTMFIIFNSHGLYGDSSQRMKIELSGKYFIQDDSIRFELKFSSFACFFFGFYLLGDRYTDGKRVIVTVKENESPVFEDFNIHVSNLTRDRIVESLYLIYKELSKDNMSVSAKWLKDK